MTDQDYFPPEAAFADVPPPRRRGRGLIKLLAFLLVLMIGFGGFGLYAVSQAKGTATGKDVTVTIAQGATASSIADQLAKQGVIRSAWLFKIVARVKGAASSLKPGEYNMRTGMSFAAVLDLLEQGPAIPFVRLTIPEGTALGQIAAIVQTKLGISKNAFLSAASSGRHRLELMPKTSKNLEGLLYPDTYFVKKSATADDVIDRLLAEFVAKTSSLDFAQARANGLSPYQAMIVASLIEREALVEQDRARIAGVIYNRLKRGMHLELDATVQYAMFLRDGVMPTNITPSDLSIDSPFNTYKIAALPPAPISNAGLASIRAALNPERHDYLYYVLSTDGKRHCFARTYEEFLSYRNRTRSCA
jgi:UPF0755 protein